MDLFLFKRSASLAIAPFLITTALLSGCGGEPTSAPKANPPQVVDPGAERKLISSLKFEDPNLTSCVNESTLHQNFVYADQVTALNCFVRGVILDSNGQDVRWIHSIAGIEQLTGLEEIKFTQQPLVTELDVSQFKHLKTLFLNGTGITKLDFSRNLELQSLTIYPLWGNVVQKPWQLDLSNNLKLMSLWASKVSELNLPRTTTLENLVVDLLPMPSDPKVLVRRGNSFEYLDGRFSVDLTPYPNLIRLGLAGSIKAVKMPTTQSLQYLNIYSGPLEELDLSRAINLQELAVNFSKNIQSLDLSRLSKLESLNLIANGIDTLDLSNQSQLTSLTLKVNGVSKLDLSKFTLLNVIDIASDNLNALTIGNLSVLRTLYLNVNKLPSLEISQLNSLRQLSIAASQLPDVQLPPLAQFDALELTLKNNSASNPPTPRKLISTVQIPDQALRNCITATALEQGITYVDEMKKLDCHGLDDKLFWMEFADRVNPPQSPNQIRQFWTHIFTTDGLEAFTEITSLDLSTNYLTSFDVTKFPKLETLKLSENFLQSINLEAAHSLKTLALNSNPLKHTKLPKNPTMLESLEFRGGSEMIYLIYIIDMTAMLNAPANVPFTYQDYRQGLGDLDLSGQTGLIYLDTTGNGKP